LRLWHLSFKEKDPICSKNSNPLHLIEKSKFKIKEMGILKNSKKE
jgi:hypothetical protein